MARSGKLDAATVARIFDDARDRGGAVALSAGQRRYARHLYLPEAVHFAKLRCALLANYGI